MVSCRLGFLYRIEKELTRPLPKEKIALCLALRPRLFAWINTDAPDHGLDQLTLALVSHRVITHACFLDLSIPMLHPDAEIDDAVECGPMISRALCQQIIERIEIGLEMLPPRYAELYLTGLRSLYRSPPAVARGSRPPATPP